MTYALILAVLSGPLSTVASLVVFARHVAARAAHEGSERAYLLQRIQDPQAAVVQHAVATTQNHEPAHLPFDDDQAWLAHIEALND